MTIERWVSPVDHRLLAALRRVPNLVHAARSIGITRDRAVYRLQRLRHLYGRPAATGHRGGGATGATTLTPFGRSLLQPMRHAPANTNRWRGIYRPGPPPHVDLGAGRVLEVSFRAPSEGSVTIEVDPESFVIARRPLLTSARNVFAARMESFRPLSSGRVLLTARWKSLRVRAILTPGSIRRLRLARGQSAYFLLKAVAVRAR